VSTEQEPTRIPFVYVGAEDIPIEFANTFVIQHENNEFVLTIGQYAPPMLLGTPDERREQAKKVTFVPIKVVGRFGFTRDRLVALIKALQENLNTYDQKHRGENQS
jgi:hypothetical protein